MTSPLHPFSASKFQEMDAIEALLCAAISHERWRPSAETRSQVMESSLAYWYRTPTIDPATNLPGSPATL